MIPPDAYRPAPGWYRHGDVLRWHTGFRWTEATKPLPRRPGGPLPHKRFTVRRLAALALVIVLVLAITAAA